MRQLMFGVLAMAMACTMLASPVAAQTERGAELNVLYGKSGGSAEGTKFPKGTAFRVSFEYPMIPNYLTTGMGFFHAGTGSANVNGLNARVSRTAIDMFALQFYPLKQSRRATPYVRFAMGYGANKFHVEGQRSQSQNAFLKTFNFGGKIYVTKRWAIVPEIMTTFGGSQRDYYTGQKYGVGVRTTAYMVGIAYCLSCE